MSRKMTEEEIKKALRIHIDDDACCYDCPYFCDDACNGELNSDALAFITEQEQEIERLNGEYNKAFERLKSQQREIERLKAENGELKVKIIDYTINRDIEAYDGIIKQAKIEMLEKLKKRICEEYTVIPGQIFDITALDIIEYIDELIEEVKAE